jgi:hypothetical protein
MIHELPFEIQETCNLIIDRASHAFPQAIGIFMVSAFHGIQIMNHPLSFHFFNANKDAAYSIASSLGVKVPKTRVLPPPPTPGITPVELERRRGFKWGIIEREIGFPCFIKPAEGRGAVGVKKVHNIEELFYHHQQSGGHKVITIQQEVKSKYDWQVRCLCIGRKIIPMKYIFRYHDMSEYISDPDFLPHETGKKIMESAQIINRVFGYDMNSVEFIIDENDQPWAIDFNNPVPDSRKEKLGALYYGDYISSMVELVKDKVREGSAAPFVPKLNQFAEIARLNISPEEKFNKALEAAESYYQGIT